MRPFALISDSEMHTHIFVPRRFPELFLTYGY